MTRRSARGAAAPGATASAMPLQARKRGRRIASSGFVHRKSLRNMEEGLVALALGRFVRLSRHSSCAPQERCCLRGDVDQLVVRSNIFNINARLVGFIP